MTSADAELSCMTVAQLAHRWGCNRKQVLGAIRRGDLQAFRIGKRAYRITIAEVERYESRKPRAA